MDHSPPIVVVGSINQDLIIEADHFLQAGESLLGSQAVYANGGKGANQAVAVARLGGEVCLVGNVGSDAFGERMRVDLSDCGVNTRWLSVAHGSSTGLAIIMLVQGENAILVSPGANNLVLPQDVDLAKEVFQPGGILLLQLEIPMETIVHTMRIASEQDMTVILDPGPAQQCPPDVLALADYITPNETEARMLTGIEVNSPQAIQRAAAILLKYARKGVVMKLGDAGSWVFADGRQEQIHALQVNVRDTTAAGDAFCSALSLALATGLDVFESARFANLVGAITVTRLGAQPSLPSRAEVDRFYSEHDNPVRLPWRS
jgi:ribokinase